MRRKHIDVCYVKYKKKIREELEVEPILGNIERQKLKCFGQYDTRESTKAINNSMDGKINAQTRKKDRQRKTWLEAKRMVKQHMQNISSSTSLDH